MVVESYPPPPPASIAPESVLPIRMTSLVVRGFGRGSTDLGIPTANLDCSPDALRIQTSTSSSSSSSDASSTAATTSLVDLPCGIYWGFAKIGEGVNATTLKCATSIGYNPTYSNNVKTVEPHLIAPPNDPQRHASSCGETLLLGNLYGKQCRLSVVGYLRPELPFEGLEKLIEAIKQDIVDTERLADGDDPTIRAEKDWVDSDEPLS